MKPKMLIANLLFVSLLLVQGAVAETSVEPTTTTPSEEETTTTTSTTTRGLPSIPCDYSETLTGRDIIDRGVVERSANCLDSFLEVHISPSATHQDDSVILRISDMEGMMYTFTDADTLDQVLPGFATRGPYVYFEGSGAWDAVIRLVERPRTECVWDEPLEGNATATLPGGTCTNQVETNSRWHFQIQGSQRVQMLDLDFQLGHPSDGFVSVRNPNGRLAIVTGRSDQLHNARLAVATDTGLTSIDVIVQNTLQDTSEYYVDVNSYAGDGVLSTTTTTTRVTVTSSGDEVDVFSLIVDEQTYYNSETGMLALQDNIISLAQGYVNPAADPANCFTFSEPRTCRERCHLTSSSDRGCVYFSADVMTSITCSYTNTQLRSDLTDDLLEQWADQVGADRIKIDECLESNETEWLVIVITMPIFVVAVLTIGFIFTFFGQKIRFMMRRKRAKSKSSSGGGSRRTTKDLLNPMGGGGLAGVAGVGAASVGGATSTGFDSHFVLEDDDGSDEGYFVGASGGSGSSRSGGGNGHHVSYYDNHLEVLDDEDD